MASLRWNCRTKNNPGGNVVLMKGQHSMLSDGITLPRLCILIAAKNADAANNRRDFAGVSQRDESLGSIGLLKCVMKI